MHGVQQQKYTYMYMVKSVEHLIATMFLHINYFKSVFSNLNTYFNMILFYRQRKCIQISNEKSKFSTLCTSLTFILITSLSLTPRFDLLAIRFCNSILFMKIWISFGIYGNFYQHKISGMTNGLSLNFLYIQVFLEKNYVNKKCL